MRKNTKLLFSLIGFLCLLGLGALLAFTPRRETQAAGTEQAAGTSDSSAGTGADSGGGDSAGDFDDWFGNE